MRYMAALSLLVALVAPAIAQSPKKPWMYTLEERIALRTSPELARERARQDRSAQTRSTSSSSSALGRAAADAFDGKTHPELFFPHEVFRSLIHLAFLGSPRTGQVVREGHMAEVRRHGLPEDFWQKLQALSAIYIADSLAEKDLGTGLQKQSGRARQRAEQQLALEQTDVCRSRADALAAARREFGRERFDRFLYEVIAVNKFHVEDRLPAPEVLRWAEEGCR